MANSEELVPLRFDLAELPELPEIEPVEISDGLAGMGVWFTFPKGHLNRLTETIETWYEARDEVILVDSGYTEKRRVGYIIMEWEGYECDQFFLDVLLADETILDYGMYEVQA
jgi:hypothetical protein